MTEPSILWLRESDVMELVSLNDAIDSLERALRLEGEGHAINPPKALANWEQSKSLHALCSVLTDRSYCGTKTWINTPNGATALYILFDGEAGKALSIMEANGLGALRTSGVSGVATNLMADRNANELALIGSGRQALLQLAAVSVVRPIRKVRIFSPTRDNQLKFARMVGDRFQISIETPEDLATAVEGAPIVTVVTRAREPFLEAGMLASGSHINAVGAILPHSAELKPDVLARAGSVVVDSLVNARESARELIEFFGSHWDCVETLGSRLASGAGRPKDSDITVFKSVGMGLSDLAVAIRAYEEATMRGVGRRIDYPVGAVPKWITLAAA